MILVTVFFLLSSFFCRFWSEAFTPQSSPSSYPSSSEAPPTTLLNYSSLWGNIVEIDLHIPPQELQHLNDAVEDKCKVELARRGASTSKVHVNASTNHLARACLGKQHNDPCILSIMGRPAVGRCLDNFVTTSRLLQCIIAEVIEGTGMCEGQDTLHACVVNYTSNYAGNEHNESHAGLCGHDSQGKGLGCYTPANAVFLHSVERYNVRPFSEVEAVVVFNGSTTWKGVKVRRHGGPSLCALLKVGVKKLPLHLDFGSASTDSVEASASHSRCVYKASGLVQVKLALFS